MTNLGSMLVSLGLLGLACTRSDLLLDGPSPLGPDAHPEAHDARTGLEDGAAAIDAHVALDAPSEDAAMPDAVVSSEPMMQPIGMIVSRPSSMKTVIRITVENHACLWSFKSQKTDPACTMRLYRGRRSCKFPGGRRS
ncbi:MAG: hypothetical protein HY698_12275 [Deltaproteobacteria bacterium]|nr:hypothetical protein [Deltaproteobacteria bacterium]